MLDLRGSFELEGHIGFIFSTKNDNPIMPSTLNNVLYNIVKVYNVAEREKVKREKRETEFAKNSAVV